MDRLDWIAGYAGNRSCFTKGLKDTVNYVHTRAYPINGYPMQALYPISSNASVIPSWQTWPVADSPFDKQLVREKMKELGVTQADLARELKLNQSAVSNILNGSRQVKVHEASYVYKRLGLELQPTVLLVPVIGIASAGNWREAVEQAGGAMPVPKGVAGERSFAIEISGDSMDRILQDGAFAVIDPEQTHLFNEKIYLIENGEHEAQVKMYRSNPARFEPCSNNELHQIIHVGQTPIRVIGRVVWQGAPL